MIDIKRAVRPYMQDQYFWFDAELRRSGLCHIDDWPVEWESVSEQSIALILPAERVIHAKVSVPNAIKDDAEAVLYTIEDQLADEVTNLHAVTVGEAEALSVRAVDRAWLQGWVDYFRTRVSRITSVVSEVDLFDAAPDVMVVGPNCVWQSNGQWLAGRFESLPMLEKAGVLPGFREIRRCECALVEPVAIKEQFDSVPVKDIRYFEGLTGDEPNLAIGSFAPSLPWRRYAEAIKWPAVALALLLVVDFATLFAERLQAKQYQETIKQAQVDVYRQVQPAGTANNPYQLMESMVTTGLGQSASVVNSALIVFGELNTDIAVDVMRVDVQPGREGVVFAVSATSLAKIDQLRNRAEQRGIAFEVEEQRMTGGRGNARIRIF